MGTLASPVAGREPRSAERPRLSSTTSLTARPPQRISGTEQARGWHETNSPIQNTKNAFVHHVAVLAKLSQQRKAQLIEVRYVSFPAPRQESALKKYFVALA